MDKEALGQTSERVHNTLSLDYLINFLSTTCSPAFHPLSAVASSNGMMLGATS